METIEEFETFVRDRVVALHMGLPQKISARKLSYAIGQSAGYINKIETGQSLPSLSGLYYICKYFGITPKEFFDDGQRAPEKLRHLRGGNGRGGEHAEALSDLSNSLAIYLYLTFILSAVPAAIRRLAAPFFVGADVPGQPLLPPIGTFTVHRPTPVGAAFMAARGRPQGSPLRRDALGRASP